MPVAGIPVVARLHHHDDLFERTVSRPLANAVDGALDLARSRFDRGQGIRHRQTEIVVAMNAHDRGIAQRLNYAADDFGIFVGGGVTNGVRDVDGSRPGGDCTAREICSR